MSVRRIYNNDGNKCFVSVENTHVDANRPIPYESITTKVYIQFYTDKLYFPNLPPNITHLAVEDFKHPQQYIPIPKTVTGLYFNGKYKHPITIPDYITTFQTPRQYDYPIILPPNIKTFVLFCEMKHPITFTGSYPTILYMRINSLLTSNICELPMMYYLLHYESVYYADHLYKRYLENLYVRIDINKSNNKRRRQGLFDTLS